MVKINSALIWVILGYTKNLIKPILILWLTPWLAPTYFIKLSGEDNHTTWEHISQYTAQLGEASAHDSFEVCLFSLSLTGTTFVWFSSLAPNSIDY
jgi:hypothetical protein